VPPPPQLPEQVVTDSFRKQAVNFLQFPLAYRHVQGQRRAEVDKANAAIGAENSKAAANTEPALSKAEIKRLEAQIRDKALLGNNSVNPASTLKKVFKYFDADGSGDISVKEFGSVLTRYSISLTKEQTQELFNHYDDDRQGTISYAEFSDVLFQ
jgi:hypothetical protein